MIVTKGKVKIILKFKNQVTGIDIEPHKKIHVLKKIIRRQFIPTPVDYRLLHGKKDITPYDELAIFELFKTRIVIRLDIVEGSHDELSEVVVDRDEIFIPYRCNIPSGQFRCLCGSEAVEYNCRTCNEFLCRNCHNDNVHFLHTMIKIDINNQLSGLKYFANAIDTDIDNNTRKYKELTNEVIIDLNLFERKEKIKNRIEELYLGCDQAVKNLPGFIGLNEFINKGRDIKKNNSEILTNCNGVKQSYQKLTMSDKEANELFKNINIFYQMKDTTNRINDIFLLLENTLSELSEQYKMINLGVSKTNNKFIMKQPDYTTPQPSRHRQLINSYTHKLNSSQENIYTQSSRGNVRNTSTSRFAFNNLTSLYRDYSIGKLYGVNNILNPPTISQSPYRIENYNTKLKSKTIRSDRRNLVLSSLQMPTTKFNLKVDEEDEKTLDDTLKKMASDSTNTHIKEDSRLSGTRIDELLKHINNCKINEKEYVTLKDSKSNESRLKKQLRQPGKKKEQNPQMGKTGTPEETEEKEIKTARLGYESSIKGLSKSNLVQNIKNRKLNQQNPKENNISINFTTNKYTFNRSPENFTKNTTSVAKEAKNITLEHLEEIMSDNSDDQQKSTMRCLNHLEYRNRGLRSILTDKSPKSHISNVSNHSKAALFIDKKYSGELDEIPYSSRGSQKSLIHKRFTENNEEAYVNQRTPENQSAKFKIKTAFVREEVEQRGSIKRGNLEHEHKKDVGKINSNTCLHDSSYEFEPKKEVNIEIMKLEVPKIQVAANNKDRIDNLGNLKLSVNQTKDKINESKMNLLLASPIRAVDVKNKQSSNNSIAEGFNKRTVKINSEMSLKNLIVNNFQTEKKNSNNDDKTDAIVFNRLNNSKKSLLERDIEEKPIITTANFAQIMSGHDSDSSGNSDINNNSITKDRFNSQLSENKLNVLINKENRNKEIESEKEDVTCRKESLPNEIQLLIASKSNVEKTNHIKEHINKTNNTKVNTSQVLNTKIPKIKQLIPAIDTPNNRSLYGKEKEANNKNLHDIEKEANNTNLYDKGKEGNNTNLHDKENRENNTNLYDKEKETNNTILYDKENSGNNTNLHVKDNSGNKINLHVEENSAKMNSVVSNQIIITKFENVNNNINTNSPATDIKTDIEVISQHISVNNPPNIRLEINPGIKHNHIVKDNHKDQISDNLKADTITQVGMKRKLTKVSSVDTKNPEIEDNKLFSDASYTSFYNQLLLVEAKHSDLSNMYPSDSEKSIKFNFGERKSDLESPDAESKKYNKKETGKTFGTSYTIDVIKEENVQVDTVGVKDNARLGINFSLLRELSESKLSSEASDIYNIGKKRRRMSMSIVKGLI
jgi:hypothetical protein